MTEAEKRGLADETNLEVFVTWYSFGGLGRGLSPMEAARMPAAMRKDFAYLLSELHRLRQRRRRLGEL